MFDNTVSDIVCTILGQSNTRCMLYDGTYRRREPKFKFCADQQGIVRLWVGNWDITACYWLEGLLRVLNRAFFDLSDMGHVDDKVIYKDAQSCMPEHASLSSLLPYRDRLGER